MAQAEQTYGYHKLKDFTVGVLGTSQRALLASNRLGYIDLNDHEQHYVVRTSDSLDWRAPQLRFIDSLDFYEINEAFNGAYYEANRSNTAQTPTIPFVITLAFADREASLTPIIPIDRIVNVQDVGDQDMETARREFVALLHDNLGRARNIAKRF